MTTQVDEFNALYADLVDGTISEAEFRRIAVANFAYTDAEISMIARRIRRRRPGQNCGSTDRRPNPMNLPTCGWNTTTQHCHHGTVASVATVTIAISSLDRNHGRRSPSPPITAASITATVGEIDLDRVGGIVADGHHRIRSAAKRIGSLRSAALRKRFFATGG